MSKYSVKKPITVLMCILMIIVLGFFGLSEMSTALFPSISLPYLVVVTPYVGADANTVYEEVTSLIEVKASSLDNYNGISSTSSEHYSMVIIEYLEETNLDKAIIELREQLNNIDFVDGVGSSTILQVSTDMIHIMRVAITTSYEGVSEDEQIIKTTEFVNDVCLDKFNAIEGVAEISTIGEADAVLQVKLNKELIANLGYTSDDILSLIQEQNINSLVGFAIDEGEIRLLYLGNAIESIEEIKSLPIPLKINQNGNIVNKLYFLSELCEEDGIKLVNENLETYSKLNGNPTITLLFKIQSDAEISEVCDEIENTLKQISNENDFFSYSIVLNQGDYINMAIGSILENLVMGAFLAVVILYLFLKDYRPTLLVGISIPLSVIASFMLMYFKGVNLNLLSMGGLALGIGMLVDNSIVVIENIYRLLAQGKSKKEAAIEGVKGVTSAIISSTLTTIIVFLPLILIGGLVTDIFKDMTYTIAFSLLSSLFIALTMIPSFGNIVLKEEKEKKKKENKLFNKLVIFYEKCIRGTINHKVSALVIVIILLVFSAFGAISKGFIMFPNTNDNSISISLEINSDSNYEAISSYIDDLCVHIKDLNSDIKDISATYGYSGGVYQTAFSGASNDISINVSLKDNHKTATDKIINNLSNQIDTFNKNNLENYYNLEILDKEFSTNNSSLSFLSSGIKVVVKGYDQNKIAEATELLAQVVKNVDGVAKTSTNVLAASENIKINVDKTYAAYLGYTQKDVLNSLNVLFENEVIASLSNSTSSTILLDGKEYELLVAGDSVLGDLSLEEALAKFGSADNFFKEVVVFEDEIIDAINEYQNINGSIYQITLDLRENSETKEMEIGYKFEINPYLVCVPNEVLDQVTNETKTIYEIFEINSSQIGEYSKYLLTKAGHYLFKTTSSKSIAAISKATGYKNVYSNGKYKTFSITASVKSSSNITKVSSKVIKAINEYVESSAFDEYRNSVLVEFDGENEQILDMMVDLLWGLLMAILLVYMIIAIQFQSLKYPLVVLATIPLAFTGGLVALIICNMSLSIISMMGLLILVGVVVNNGIVLIDYINSLREEGMDVIEACVEAGKVRLRPILMTALTTIFGLSALALGIGNGSELLQPLAVTAIGGLLYATLLTLVVVPAFYVLVTKKKGKVKNNQ